MRLLGSFTFALTLVLFAYAPFTFAQTADEEELALVYGDKATISIATGNQQALRRAPAVTTVITAADIAAIGATDLDEVLETVPGIHVSRSANMYSPLYVIRGIYSSFNPQTLMLQDGVPMTTLFIGNRGNGWGGFPLENVARIEIIRGPGSALYGSDAYSGVINIVTKTANEFQGTLVGARAGSFSNKDAWVLHGGESGPAALAAYLRVGKNGGFERVVTADALSRAGMVNTGHDAIDANISLQYEKWRLRGGYKLRDDIGTGAGVASVLDPVGKQKSVRTNFDVSWNDPHFAPDWGLGVTTSYLQYKQLFPTPLQLYPAGVTFATGTFADGMIGAPETWENQIRLSAFATYAGIPGHNMRFGLGYDDLNIYRVRERKNFTFAANGMPVPTGSVIDFTDIAPFLRPQERRVKYLYVQDEWNFARDWTLTAGVRHDQYSDFGGTTNPRLALVWDATLDVTAKLLYGRAFRAPSFNEQSSINNPVAKGNPALRPETINTLELALSWQLSRNIHFNGSVFHFDMEDIIRTVPNPTPNTGSTFNNTGNQVGNGVELEIVWDASRNVRMSSHYAYQRSIDRTSNQDAGYAPRHHIYGRADWRIRNGWMLSGQINHVAGRRRAADDNRLAIKDYSTVDLTLRADMGRSGWLIAASIRNLFNADVREPSLAPGLAIPNDLPMAPRTMYVQLNHSF